MTRNEFEVLENSSLLFQEVVALLLGSESIKQINLSNVLTSQEIPSENKIPDSIAASVIRGCEIIPPIVLLLRSLQTRCYSIILDGNHLSEADTVGLGEPPVSAAMLSHVCGNTHEGTGRLLQNRPNFMKCLSCSGCGLDDAAVGSLWESFHEQRSSLDIISLSHNPGRVDAAVASETLREANRLRRLNLAYSLRGNLDGPLFRPWNRTGFFDPWRLEELDLSGWSASICNR